MKKTSKHLATQQCGASTGAKQKSSATHKELTDKICSLNTKYTTGRREYRSLKQWACPTPKMTCHHPLRKCKSSSGKNNMDLSCPILSTLSITKTSRAHSSSRLKLNSMKSPNLAPKLKLKSLLKKTSSSSLTATSIFLTGLTRKRSFSAVVR